MYKCPDCMNIVEGQNRNNRAIRCEICAARLPESNQVEEQKPGEPATLEMTGLSISEILEAVDDGSLNASEVLEYEQAQGRPRVTLVRELKERL